MTKTADVIVIGSGVIGCAAAYYMAKKGMSVLVLDQDESVGNGGSSRNGGGVRQSGRDPRELPLAIYGVENVWPTLSDVGGRCRIPQRRQSSIGQNRNPQTDFNRTDRKSRGLRSECPND